MSSDSQSTISLSSASSGSQDPQVAELEKRIRDLEKRNAVLQHQFDMQFAPLQTAPDGYRPVPLISRPFTGPYLWPIRPSHATEDDLAYAWELWRWSNSMASHIYDDIKHMKAQRKAWSSFKKRWLEETGEELSDPALARQRQDNVGGSTNNASTSTNNNASSSAIGTQPGNVPALAPFRFEDPNRRNQ